MGGSACFFETSLVIASQQLRKHTNMIAPNRKLRPIAARPLALLALLGAASLANANHVDFLQTGPFSQIGTGNGEVTGLPTSEVLGGVRGYNVQNGGAPNSASMSFAAGGPVIMTAAGGSDIFTLRYGSFTSAGNLGANFVDTPSTPVVPDWDQITIRFSAITGSGQLGLTVVSGATTMPFAGQTVSAGNGLVYNFLHSELPGINFNSIDGLNLTVTSTGSDSFSLASITRTMSVPEPSSALVAGLFGLVGLVRRRR